jgi:hypothetical protein
VVLGIYRMVQSTFWSILVTRELMVPEQYLSLYPFVRSIIMLLFFFFVMPRLRQTEARTLMAAGLGGFVLSLTILIAMPAQSYGLLVLTAILDGCSLPLASTPLDKLVATTVDAQERARTMAILYTVVLLITSPFGWIAGRISEVGRRLPFVLAMALAAIGLLLSWLGARIAARREEPELVERPVQA